LAASIAIESISEAFSLYDNEDHLAACNSKYRTLIFPNVADESLVGLTFETLIRRAAEFGDIEDARDRIHGVGGRTSRAPPQPKLGILTAAPRRSLGHRE